MFKKKKQIKNNKKPVLDVNNVTYKILVIGHNLKIKDIDSISWNEIQKEINLADYNVVIIDFSIIDKIPFPLVKEIQYKNLWNLVFNNKAEIIIIGSPKEITTEIKEHYSSCFSPVSLLPVEVEWTIEKGNTINLVNEKYKYYFDKVKEWNFHFDNLIGRQPENKIVNISQNIKILLENIKCSITPVAVNLYDKPISCLFNFTATTYDKKVINSCSIIWLPPISIGDKAEVIKEILDNKYNFFQKSIEPEWILNYNLLSMVSINNEIENLNKEIELIEDKKKAQIEKYNKKKLLRNILYEQGKALEIHVADALKELGCEIIENKEKFNEDIQFKDPNGLNWIVEVKGRTGNLKRDDIRQLDDWVKKLILEKNWTGYAVIIGNYQCNVNPNDRKNIISENEQKSLKRFGFNLITTLELYSAIKRKENGNFNEKKYWLEKSKALKLFE